MSIEDDVALLERVPTLKLLGSASLRMLAIGSEQRNFGPGDVLFAAGEEADAGFVVQRGAFRIEDGVSAEIVAGPTALIGELALVVAMKRPSTAIALDNSSVIRIPRTSCPSAWAGRRRPSPSAMTLCNRSKRRRAAGSSFNCSTTATSSASRASSS